MNSLKSYFTKSFSSGKADTNNSAGDGTTANGASADIYHEKQVKELCAVHALNNLFQEPFFTKAILDDCCVQLAPEDFINPHRSILGRGNYNINVIMKAVQLKEHEVIWFDKRRSVAALQLNKIRGFILNVPSDVKIFGNVIPLPWERKHWLAICTKPSNNTSSDSTTIYYLLDSKQDKPERLGDAELLRAYLENSVVKSKDKELFVIVSKEVEADGSWRISTS